MEKNFGTPANLQLTSIKPVIGQVIGLMEFQFFRARGTVAIRQQATNDAEIVEDELKGIEYSQNPSALLKQIKSAFDLAVVHRVPVVWCARSHCPVTLLYLAFCQAANIECGQFLEGYLTEGGMDSLAYLVRRVVRAPLQMFNARPPGAFQALLDKLVKTNHDTAVVCDWPPAADELAAAQRLAGKSKLTFIFHED